MSQELIGIIIAAIALAAILVPGQWALRKDIATLGESTRKDMSDLRKDIAAMAERGHLNLPYNAVRISGSTSQGNYIRKTQGEVVPIGV